MSSDPLTRLRTAPELSAILLDVDGSLAPIVAHPDDSAVPAETLADMGARARRLGEQYSWPAAAATTQQLYASLIG